MQGNPARTRCAKPNTLCGAFGNGTSDLHLGTIDKAKAREFRDALAKVPTRLPRDVVRLPLRDLLKADMSGLPATHANTINKSMALLSAIVAHAMREGKMDHVANYANPFQGIKLSIDDREAEARGIFDAADLKAIFGTAVYARESAQGEAAERRHSGSRSSPS